MRNVFEAAEPSYDSLADSFAEGDLTSLHASISAHLNEYKADQNLGLVNQLQEAMIGHRIRNLTATYMSMPLTDLAKVAGLDNDIESLETKLNHLVEKGDIKAKIDSLAGMVRFVDDKTSEVDVDYEMLQLLQLKLNQTIEMAGYIRTIQKDTITSKENVVKYLRSNPSVGRVDDFDGMEIREDYFDA